jgi:hypothetical protein
MIQVAPDQRPSADEILKNEWFVGDTAATTRISWIYDPTIIDIAKRVNSMDLEKPRQKRLKIEDPAPVPSNTPVTTEASNFGPAGKDNFRQQGGNGSYRENFRGNNDVPATPKVQQPPPEKTSLVSQYSPISPVSMEAPLQYSQQQQVEYQQVPVQPPQTSRNTNKPLRRRALE